MLWLATRRVLCALALALLVAGCDSGGVTSGDGRIYAGGRSFGHALALDGDVALISALESEETFFLSKSDGNWTTSERFSKPADAQQKSSYGQSVDVEGDVGVVGAPVYSVGYESPGQAYIFEKQGGKWKQVARLSPPGAPGGILFGQSVATSNGRVAVTSNEDPAPSAAKGAVPAAVRIYEKSGSGWAETARIEEPELSPEGRTEGFGSGIALDGDRLAVSSPSQEVGGVSNAGVIRIYETRGGAWSQVAVLSNPAPRPDDPLGYGIAFDGPILAASALARGILSGQGSGAVLVFREAGGAWAYEAELRPDDLGTLDSYGFALAADSGPLGDRVAVSAAGRAESRGSVFVWVRRPSGAWELEAELWPEGIGKAAFGEGLALDGDRLLAGAIYDQGGRGGVYEFRLGPGGWTQVK